MSGSGEVRDIAQLGRVPALGVGCHRFESYYPEPKTIYLFKFKRRTLQ